VKTLHRKLCMKILRENSSSNEYLQESVRSDIGIYRTQQQNGKLGFSKARWDFWKSRAEWVAGLNEVHKNASDAARKMAEAMSSIEEAGL
jgi:hypothetical protein